MSYEGRKELHALADDWVRFRRGETKTLSHRWLSVQTKIMDERDHPARFFKSDEIQGIERTPAFYTDEFINPLQAIIEYSYYCAHQFVNIWATLTGTQIVWPHGGNPGYKDGSHTVFPYVAPQWTILDDPNVMANIALSNHRRYDDIRSLIEGEQINKFYTDLVNAGARPNALLDRYQLRQLPPTIVRTRDYVQSMFARKALRGSVTNIAEVRKITEEWAKIPNNKHTVMYSTDYPIIVVCDTHTGNLIQRGSPWEVALEYRLWEEKALHGNKAVSLKTRRALAQGDLLT